jgi:D-alanyl-D-alanine carboxypeptidase
VEKRTALLARLLLATAVVTASFAVGTAGSSATFGAAGPLPLLQTFVARTPSSADLASPELSAISPADSLDAAYLPTKAEPTAAPTPPAPPPPCAVGDVLAPRRAYDEHAWTLLDWTYMLPADYVPPDLVRIDGIPARSIIASDLQALRTAASRDGIRLSILSGYRSFAQQRTTFAAEVARLGQSRAILVSARPGHSEHQLGTTLDFATAGGSLPWQVRDWAQTREGAWLARRGWEFGFVMSYPNGKQGVTCYGYEPWHYRWIGRDGAAALRESGLTLREFLLRSASLRAAPIPA